MTIKANKMFKKQSNLLKGCNDIDFEKCGDVIVAPKCNIFALTCSLCHDVFMEFDEFKFHIQGQHDVYLGFISESEDEAEISNEKLKESEKAAAEKDKNKETNDKLNESGANRNCPGDSVQSVDDVESNQKQLNDSEDQDMSLPASDPEKEQDLDFVSKNTPAEQQQNPILREELNLQSEGNTQCPPTSIIIADLEDDENSKKELPEDRQESTTPEKENHIDLPEQSIDGKKVDDKKLKECSGEMEMELDEILENTNQETRNAPKAFSDIELDKGLTENISQEILQEVNPLKTQPSPNCKNDKEFHQEVVSEKTQPENIAMPTEKLKVHESSLGSDMEVDEELSVKPVVCVLSTGTPMEEEIGSECEPKEHFLDELTQQGVISTGESNSECLLENKEQEVSEFVDCGGNIQETQALELTEKKDMEHEKNLDIESPNAECFSESNRAGNEEEESERNGIIQEAELDDPYQEKNMNTEDFNTEELPESNEENAGKENEYEEIIQKVQSDIMDQDENFNSAMLEKEEKDNSAYFKNQHIGPEKDNQNENEPENTILTTQERQDDLNNEKGFTSSMESIKDREPQIGKQAYYKNQHIASPEKDHRNEKEPEKNIETTQERLDNLNSEEGLTSSIERIEDQETLIEKQAVSQEIDKDLEEITSESEKQSSIEEKNHLAGKSNLKECNDEIIQKRVDDCSEGTEEPEHNTVITIKDKTSSQKDQINVAEEKKESAPSASTDAENKSEIIKEDDNFSQRDCSPKDKISKDVTKVEVSCPSPALIRSRRKSVKLAALFEELLGDDMDLDIDDDLKVIEELVLREENSCSSEDDKIQRDLNQKREENFEEHSMDTKENSNKERVNSNENLKNFAAVNGFGNQIIQSNEKNSPDSEKSVEGFRSEETTVENCPDNEMNFLKLVLEEDSLPKTFSEEICENTENESNVTTEEMETDNNIHSGDLTTDQGLQKENKNSTYSVNSINKNRKRKLSQDNSMESKKSKMRASPENIAPIEENNLKIMKNGTENQNRTKEEDSFQTSKVEETSQMPLRTVSILKENSAIEGEPQVAKVSNNFPQRIPPNDNYKDVNMSSKIATLNASETNAKNSPKSLEASYQLLPISNGPTNVYEFDEFSFENREKMTKISKATPLNVSHKDLENPAINSNQNNSYALNNSHKVPSIEEKENIIKKPHTVFSKTEKLGQVSANKLLPPTATPTMPTIQRIEILPRANLTPSLNQASQRSLPDIQRKFPVLPPGITLRSIGRQSVPSRASPVSRTPRAQENHMINEKMKEANNTLDFSDVKLRPGLTLKSVGKPIASPSPPSSSKSNASSANLSDEDKMVTDLLDQVSNESANESFDTQSASGDLKLFTDESDTALLQKFGLSIIKNPESEDIRSNEEIYSNRNLAKSLSQVFDKSGLVRRNPATTETRVNEIMLMLLESVNGLIPKESAIALEDLKRLLNLVTLWYVKQYQLIYMEKKTLPENIIEYLKFFSYIPRSARNNYYCEYCTKYFSNEAKLELHRNSHSQPLDALTCPHCFKIFKRVRAFELHILKCRT